jgi:hypothetical protein
LFSGRRSTIFTPAALVAAGVFMFWLLHPPSPQWIDGSSWSELAARTVAGAYHIHTTRSDGHGDRRDVAAAARRAGLQFVILTDHGDGTRPPDPPEYIDGVLVLDAVEISTDGGHYVALDMPRAPYPLGGAADTVVEDVARLGGFGIAAHPDSPKPALRWTDASLPVDGIEWLNADSEWRDESRTRLVRVGLGYLLRPGPALAMMLDRPVTLERWDRQSRGRRLIAVAGVDAHGGVGRRVEDPNRTLFGTVGIPSYYASFRTFTNRVVLDRPLSGEPAADRRALFGGIRMGRVYTTIDALAGPGLLDWRQDGNAVVAQGALPRGAMMVLFRDGQEVARAAGMLRHRTDGAPGVYRVEVHMPGAPGTPPIPWLVSNAIYAGISPVSGSPHSPLPPAAVSTIRPFPWRIEKDPASSAILRTSDRSVELQYKLAEGSRESQFVALSTDVHGESFDAVDLSLAADRPARVWVQVRTVDGSRWGRTFYVDPAGIAIRAQLSSLRPLRPMSGDGPSIGDSKILTSILIVADLTNASPGRAGTLTVLSSALAR